jgi:hypothetical protein
MRGINRALLCILLLAEFSGVNDTGMYKGDLQISDFEESNYACGFFWFKKE